MTDEINESRQAASEENRANRMTSLYQSSLDEIERLRGFVLHLLYCPKQACSYCTTIEKEFRNER